MRGLKWHRMVIAALSLCGLFLVSVINVPQLLAFPYKAQYGSSTVYSEVPIGPEMKDVMAQADALTRKSAIYAADGYATNIFLTDGGWRWTLLALQSRGAFAISRSFSNGIIINRTDIFRKMVRNGKMIGGARSLSSVIAHERTHGLIRHRYGRLEAVMLPTMNVEGYCDYVAQESSLTPAQYEALKAKGQSHPAMPYYEGRMEAMYWLDIDGISVDQFLTLR